MRRYGSIPHSERAEDGESRSGGRRLGRSSRADGRRPGRGSHAGRRDEVAALARRPAGEGATGAGGAGSRGRSAVGERRSSARSGIDASGRAEETRKQAHLRLCTQDTEPISLLGVFTSPSQSKIFHLPPITSNLSTHACSIKYR
jgi:hypothetical protein